MVENEAAAELKSFGLSARTQVLVLACLIVLGGAGIWLWQSRAPASGGSHTEPELSSQSKRSPDLFYPSAAQWATLTIEPVEQRGFRSEHITEGKVAVNEDRSTLIFSPYSGRVTKLMAKPGDTVTAGQPLFTIEASDVVQVQNDFLAAVGALNKARSQLRLAEIVEKRTHDLYEGKAIALKEWQNAQNELTGAQNDLRSAEAALQAVRNRLRILGRTEEEITAFQQKGQISAETPIFAPFGGTIVQRKAGPGQYLNAGSSDPVFVIGDLSTVWLVAYVRETDAPRMRVGQKVQFTVLAYPNRMFEATLDYVAASLDPATRRLLVRATVPNPEGLLKLEMFANVTIYTGEGDVAVAVPREAVIYEGDVARVWVARDGQAIELRRVKIGLGGHKMLQVVEGLNVGEKIVTKGALFIDRVAAGS